MQTSEEKKLSYPDTLREYSMPYIDILHDFSNGTRIAFILAKHESSKIDDV